jgi:hypothetical protein
MKICPSCRIHVAEPEDYIVDESLQEKRFKKDFSTRVELCSPCLMRKRVGVES